MVSDVTIIVLDSGKLELVANRVIRPIGKRKLGTSMLTLIREYRIR